MVNPETKDQMTQSESRTPGDGWAVEALERFERPLLAYARRFTGDLDAARDLVQDAFLKLCEHPLASDDPRLGPWLFHVCRNRAIDRLRKEGPVRLWEEPDRMPDVALDTERKVESQDEADRLAASLRALPPRQGEAVWLKFRGGLTYRQIAEVMDESVSNVGFLLHTAIQDLRRRLSGTPVTTAVEEAS